MNQELHHVFLEELADIYNAEQQLTKALPKLAKAAGAEELREAIESHLQETQEQISRLDQVFESLDEPVKRKTCQGMKGLIDEAQQVLKDHKGSAALDAAIIAAAQKSEHYEIATYGCLCTWAELMGHDEALELLKKNLAEEKAADETLTEVAESVANVEAQQQKR